MEELALPPTLYGLVIAEPLQLDRHVDGNFIYFTEILKNSAMLGLNYLVQGTFLSQLWDLNVEKESWECREDLVFAQHVCVFVFCISVFSEFRDSMDLIHLIVRTPVSPGHYQPVVQIGGHQVTVAGLHERAAQGAVLEREPTSHFGGIGGHFFDRFDHAMRRKHKSPVEWDLSRMGYRWKAFCLLVVGLPRLVITLLLSWLGASYILKSGDAETMMLNTLAVLFVIDIDDFMYNAFTADATKVKMLSVTPLELSPSNYERYLHFIFNSFAYPGIVVGATFGFVGYEKSSCSNGDGWWMR